ncbi:hypothetical protein D3C80_973490 [compost metagenome]
MGIGAIVGLADRRAQQTDNRLQGRFAFLPGQVLLAGGIEDQSVRQHRDGRGCGNPVAAPDLIEAQGLLDQLIRQDQRQLPGVFAVGEVAGPRSIDQRDVAGGQQDLVVALGHARRAVELEHRKILAALARRDFLGRTVQPRLAHVDETEFERIALVFADAPGKFAAQGLCVEGATDLVDLMDPLVEPIMALCCCRNHVRPHAGLFLLSTSIHTTPDASSLLNRTTP